MYRIKGKAVRSVFLGLLSAFLCANLTAQTFSGGGFTIADGQGRVPSSCSSVTVSGITSNVGVRSITITNIFHTAIGDTQTSVFRPGQTPSNTSAGIGTVISSPPDAVPCNFAGTYRYIDTATQSVDDATFNNATGLPTCSTTDNLPPGDYRSSAYGGSVQKGPITSIPVLFGTLTPTQVNGTWLVCVFDYAAGDTGTVGGTSITFSTFTASGVSVTGRVATSKGRGLQNVILTLTDQAGTSRQIKSGANGVYSFDDVATGQTYVLNIMARNYGFAEPTQFITVSDSIAGLDFTALAPARGK